MENLKKIIIGNNTFYKTSYSRRDRDCVGVSFDNKKVKVINTNEGKTIVEFDINEWDTFIKGVKRGDFDNLTHL